MEFSLEVDAAILIGAGLLLTAALVSAFVTGFGERLRVPSALLFLGLGMLAGDDALGMIELSDPVLVQNLGVMALLFVLFEGGLSTKPTDLRQAALPGVLLATLGVLATAAITALCVWWLLPIEPITAAMIGAVVSSTDVAAVFSMMRVAPLPRRLSALLRLESGANDPIAVMLTLGVLAAYTEGVSAGQLLRFALIQLGGGIVIGLVAGALGVALLRRVEFGSEGLYPLVAVAFGGLAYGLGALAGASGFVAVYVTGFLIGTFVPRHRRAIRGFNESTANAAEIGLFLLLGLLVFPSQLLEVAVPGLLVALVLTLVARPLTVALFTVGQGYDWREKALVSWGGLRGAVPIVLATFPLAAGFEGGDVIFNVVFFVVLVSVLVQGLSLLPLTHWLGLDTHARTWSPVAEALPLDGVDIDLIEIFVEEDLELAYRRLRDMPELGRALVAAVVRGGRVLIPTGETQILPKDVLLLTAERRGDVVARLTAWARGEDPPPVSPRDARSDEPEREL